MNRQSDPLRHVRRAAREVLVPALLVSILAVTAITASARPAGMPTPPPGFEAPVLHTASEVKSVAAAAPVDAPVGVAPAPVAVPTPARRSPMTVPLAPPRVTPAPHAPEPRTSALHEDFESYPSGEQWPQGAVRGLWQTVFNGYGYVGATDDGSRALELSPQAATDPAETHAALVLSTKSFGDVDLVARVRTVRQLRASAPNPWEVGWVLFRYADPTHFYYLVLKPNGWELGKEDPAYPGAQRFLATGSDRVFPTGRWYDVHVRMTGATVTVDVDGAPLITFTDEERPYGSGSVGLYSEDATVHIDDVRVNERA